MHPFPIRLELIPPINSSFGSRNLHLKRSNKRRLRDFGFAELAHPFLALFLLIQKLAFTRRVAAGAFGGHVFTQGGDGFAGVDISRLYCLLGEREARAFGEGVES